MPVARCSLFMSRSTRDVRSDGFTCRIIMGTTPHKEAYRRINRLVANGVAAAAGRIALPNAHEANMTFQ